MAEDLAIQQAIQMYLNTSNRPYNANNLIDEFATKFKKPKVIKALQALEDSKAIQVKLFGKIKIFLADQKQFPVPSEEELKRIDEDIEQYGERLKKLQDEVQAVTSKNNDLERMPTDVALEEQLKALAATVAALSERLASCKASGGAVSHLPPKDVMEQQIRSSASALGKRQRLCESIIDYMLQDERGRMSREEVEFMLGISD